VYTQLKQQGSIEILCLTIHMLVIPFSERQGCRRVRGWHGDGEMVAEERLVWAERGKKRE